MLEAASLEVCGSPVGQPPPFPSASSVVNGAHGLLRPGFVAPEQVRRLRSYQRLRDDHIEMAGAHVQHMQKAFELLNIKLPHVINSLTGASGLRIVRAILDGERDAPKLAALGDAQILKTKRERVLFSLEAVWREEHLFALRQGLEGWEFYQAQSAACDREIARILGEMAAAAPPPTAPPPGASDPRRLCRSANAPQCQCSADRRTAPQASGPDSAARI